MARLIDLGEALRMVQNSKDDCPETSIKGRAIWETAHNCAISCLTNCDTVDAVEVVHGKWTITDDDYLCLTTLECSVCGEQYCFEEYDEQMPPHYHYCPNCGADMMERSGKE